MSAPQTNIDNQVRRHRWSLYGAIGASMLAGIFLGALITFQALLSGETPEGAEEMIDGRTGAVEETGPEVVAPMPTIGKEATVTAEPPAITRTVDPEPDLPRPDPTD